MTFKLGPILVTCGILLPGLRMCGAPIPGLFNTGINTNGALLASGSIEPHWQLIQSADTAFPGPAARVLNDSGFPIPPWLANGPNSKWIAPQANQATGNQPGDYKYRVRFNLTGLDPATAAITGRWSSDNAGAEVLINGQSTGITYDGNFGAFSPPFTISTGFVDGTNTLDFVVNNAPPGINPTGFRAELSGTAEPLPPPGTPPSIVIQPASQSIGVGDGATFRVGASGARPLSYQWRLNGTPIFDATNASYTITSVSADSVGTYDVIVTNPWGTAASAPATVTLIYLSPAQLTYEPLGPSSRRTGLAFSEIMYHPRDRTDGRNLEFIEIYNSNPFAEDISGWRISGEVDFTFPASTPIPGLGFVVVARVPADVEAIYGINGVLGPFTNNLANSGGTLRLRKKSDAIVLELTYSDEPPWPVPTDGAGHSLVLAKPSYGENDPKAWAHSASTGGSPGAADPVPAGPLENVVLNELAGHLDDGEADFIELFNASLLPVDISGCHLSDRSFTNKFRIPDGTVIGPSGFAVFTVFYDIGDLHTNQLGFALRALGETIYFWNSNETRVLDAVRWDNQGEDFSWGRFPDGSPYFLPGERTRGTNNVIDRGVEFELGQTDIRKYPVVINEIMYNPISGDNDDEFVELHNFSTNTINIGGWRLTGGISYEFPSNAVIPALGYVVVAENLTNLLARYPNLASANTFGDWQGNLSNGGETLVLRRPELLRSPTDITTVLQVAKDEVTYETGGRWPKWTDGGGSSLELIDPRSPWRIGPNWAASDETAKAQWTLVETTGVLDLGHPSRSTADQLQVFLQGAGEALVDDVEVLVGGVNRIANPGFESGTSGWFFQGTHRRTYWETNGGFNSARSLHLVATERGDHVANRVRVPLSTAIPANTMVTIRAKVRWLRGHPEILFRLRGGFLEAVGRLNVPSNPGTPGAANTAARTNAGPLVTEVSHRPVLPAANHSIRVFARVLDPDGVQSVLLRYRLDPSASISTVAMVDDATGADALPGDSIYTGVIPGQPNGTLLAFHVVTTDGFTSPASTQFPDDAPARECLIRVGDVMPGNSFGTYRFWMTQASHNFWASREKMSNEDVDATFIYGDWRVVYNVGAHYSGSSYTAPIYTTPTGALCGYDINFPDDDRVLGENHFTFDWPIRDDTNQREQLMYWFLEQFGLPNMYRRYVNLYVNGVKRGTIYDDIQQPGGDTIEEWFAEDSEGNFYKTDCWNEFDDNGNRTDPCILNSLEAFLSGGMKKMARYRWNWRPRAIHGTANDFEDLFALVDAVNAPPAAHPRAVACVVDMEHWMRTFAMNDLASFWDAFGNPNAKNTYLYKPERGGWKLLCWDFDVGLGVFNDPVTDPLFPGNVDPTVQRLYNTPGFVRAYWRALEEALNTFFRVGADSAIDAILDAKYAAFQANGIALSSPAGIKTWITQRRNFLQTQLNTVATNFSVTGTNSFSTNRDLITLSGTAPVRVHTIVVNGVPYPATWSLVGQAPVRWSINIPVSAGTNALEIVGLDRFGHPVLGASRTVTVEYAGENARPEDFVVINEIMYNPVVPEASYIEIFNSSLDHAFDLSGWRLSGADFTFPRGTIITNRGMLVVAKNCARFWIAYGTAIPVIGEFAGQLDDGGETLSLIKPGATSAEDLIVDRVTYDDDPPWPASADGQGASLQLIDVRQDNSRVSNWSDGAGWRFFSYTANPGASGVNRLSLFLTNFASDVYLDDIALVEGTVAALGTNLIANGDFESAVLAPWNATAIATNSMLTSEIAHSGNQSLHLVFASGGAALTHFYQDLTNVVASGVQTSKVHTLSFWFISGTNSHLLQARLNAFFRAVSDIRPVRTTPGAMNNAIAELPAFPPLWLSELAPNPLDGVTDNFGETEPWIELHNSGSAAISFDGFYLADNFTNLARWAFPAGASIQPGEYLLVWADGEPGQSSGVHLHAGFRLGGTNGAVALSRSIMGAPQIIDYLTYRNVPVGRSFGSHPPAQASYRQEFYYPSPRGTNDPAAPAATLFINEWMAANASFIRDPADQDFDDWFELYNPNEDRVDLTGYWISDTLSNPNKFIVPTNITIAPRGFLLVWADEESSQTRTNGDLHVNFRLSQSGEAIALYSPQGRLIDSVVFAAQTNNLSQGRYPDGMVGPFPFMPEPTPSFPNRIAQREIRFLEVAMNGNMITLRWSAEPGRSYRVQSKNELSDPEWTDLPGGSAVAGGPTASLTEPIDRAQRFYRVQLVP